MSKVHIETPPPSSGYCYIKNEKGEELATCRKWSWMESFSKAD